MVSEKILVGSALGIHLRPAGAMCDTAVKFDSHITDRKSTRLNSSHAR